MMTVQLIGLTVMRWWLALTDIRALWRDAWVRRRSSSAPRSSHSWRFTTTITWCQHGQSAVTVCIPLFDNDIQSCPVEICLSLTAWLTEISVLSYPVGKDRISKITEKITVNICFVTSVSFFASAGDVYGTCIKKFNLVMYE